MFGYAGQILEVDLSNHVIRTIPIDTEISSKFLGGSGFASRFLYDILNPDADPLGPENMLLFMTGPLTGTIAPSTGRHVVCGKSPITGLWGESHCGGHFGERIRAAGFDGILIKGVSKTPVLLEVNEQDAEILRADHLWGLNTSETQEILKKTNQRVQVSCIGPAGENLVKFASIVSGERVAARCGLGAVMGSKKLKAISLSGSHALELASPDEFHNLALASSKILGKKMSLLRDQGTAHYIDIGMMFNDLPIRYFQDVEFANVDLINGTALKKILTGRDACYSCPIACGRKVSLSEHNLVNIAGPEYQTIASFGTNLLISDLKKIVLMNRLCNQYGLDTISCGSTIALATLLCEIGKADYGFKWNDSDSVLDSIHKIARREGIGNILAEGSLALGQKCDAEDIVLHVRGLEIPNHDPRAFFGMASIYAIASRGATHLEGDMYSVDLGTDVQELGIIRSDRLQNKGKGETAARSQDFRAFFDSLIMCHFAEVPPKTIIKLLNLATGRDYTIADILAIGARAVTMKRLFNLRSGLKTSDEVLPLSIISPHPEAVTSDFVPDVEMQLKEYYEYRKWDRVSGEPSKEALESLELVID
jgi:aldehyde:ferredoxin oxidoreductase